MIRAIITDIEGTTTSVSFVYDVLFPYAREHMAAFIHQHRDDQIVREQLQLVSLESGSKLDEDLAIAQLLTWMEADKKITPLKTLQGLIWEHGYQQGHFKGHIYDDVPRNLRRWHAQGIALYVYSSGSVQAQKLLFANTAEGDLTGLFSGYFDTRIGNKRESTSYERIVNQTGLAAQQLLFLSDIEQELEAAEQAGLKTVLLVRDADKPAGSYHQVHNFDQIQID
jgi:enolase-phosphatase E1